MGAGEQKPAFPPGDPDQNSQAPQEHHTWAPQKGPDPSFSWIAGYPPEAWERREMFYFSSPGDPRWPGPGCVCF
jgi:hypothetical protein